MDPDSRWQSCAHICSHKLYSLPPQSTWLTSRTPQSSAKETFLASPLLTHMLKEWLLPLHGLGTLWALTKGCMLVHFWLFKLTFASRFLSWWLQLSYLSVVFVVWKTGPCGEFRIPANTELQHWVWCWLHCVAHIPAHLVISCTTKALNTNVYLKGQEKRSNGSWPMLLFGAVPVWHI